MKRPERIPELVTARLVLRGAELADASDLLAVFGDPVAMRYWSTPAVESRAQVDALLERAQRHFAEGTGMLWCVRRGDDRRAIGTISMHRFDEQNDRAEVGYILGRAAWGNGFMTEALSAVVEYAFGPMGLRRLEADTDPRNAGSIRLLERLGFRREGLLRERWIVKDEVCDSAFFGLLRSEWRPGGPAQGGER